MSDSARTAIETAFMYICTTSKDSFLNSMISTTKSDLGLFDFYPNEPNENKELALEFKLNLRIIITHISMGGFTMYGEILKETQSQIFITKRKNPTGIIKQLERVTNSFFGKFKKSGQEAPKLSEASERRNSTRRSSVKITAEQAKHNGENLFEITTSLCKLISEAINDKKMTNFKISLTSQGIPILIITL